MSRFPHVQFPLSRKSPIDRECPCKIVYAISLEPRGNDVQLLMEQEGTKGQDLIAIKEDATVKIVLRGDQLFFSKGYDAITTEVLDAPEFYFAEDYHQQYLAKNPRGYCGLGGTGVSCPIGTGVAAH